MPLVQRNQNSTRQGLLCFPHVWKSDEKFFVGPRERASLEMAPGLSSFFRLFVAGVLLANTCLGNHATVPSVTEQMHKDAKPTGPAVMDAVLFRTHFVDAMIVKKLSELARSSKPAVSASPAPGQVLPSSDFEISVLYDADTAPEFPFSLNAAGFNHSALGVNLMGLHLKHFTRYPSVKPTPIAKSHNQHLAYTSWWQANKRRRNWRYIWCIEHDVAVTGGVWRSVFDAHLVPPHSERDFVSWRVGWALRGDKVHGGGQWNIGQRHGKVGRSGVPDNQVSLHFGPMLRFSSKFLELLETESAVGTTGHAEVVPPTLCNITKWCKMGNISVAVMGGRDGGLFDYKLPLDISSPIYAALEELVPGKVFHPVRDVGTASDKDAIARSGSAETQHHAAKSMATQQSRYMAMCLLRNPRPPRPSYNCPFGCPWHEQITCPTVNCMAREPGTYHHMGHQSCYKLCMTTKQCPWTTNTFEALKLAEQGIGFTPVLEGDFNSVAGPI